MILNIYIILLLFASYIHSSSGSDTTSNNGDFNLTTGDVIAGKYEIQEEIEKGYY